MKLQRYRAYGAGTGKTVAGGIPMNLKWTSGYGAELLGQKLFAAVKRKHRRRAIPRNVEHFQLPFRQWDGRIKRSMKEDLRKGRGQVYPLDERKPIRSCNEIEVAKILRHFREHAFWVSAFSSVKPEIWRPSMLSISELPNWLKNLDSAIRERINSPAGGLPDVVAWNDDHPSHSAMFVECKGFKEDFKEAQEDWLWAALCEGIKVSQFAVSVRAF